MTVKAALRGSGTRVRLTRAESTEPKSGDCGYQVRDCGYQVRDFGYGVRDSDLRKLASWHDA